MKWYGSAQNRISAECEMPKPEVGMGVTELLWSDREPYEVIEVISEKKIRIRELTEERIDNNGISEHQEYRLSPNPDGEVKTLVLRNGKWRDLVKEERYIGDQKWETIETRRLGSSQWLIGRAEKYRDPSF
jgi:hypothetical protein